MAATNTAQAPRGRGRPREPNAKSRRPEYGIWCGIKTRCSNPRHSTYKRYGARGIKMCERWESSFEAFLEDMGPRPSPRHSIDRIDPDGHYEPGNCRWATPELQRKNRKALRGEWARHEKYVARLRRDIAAGRGSAVTRRLLEIAERISERHEKDKALVLGGGTP